MFIETDRHVKVFNTHCEAQTELEVNSVFYVISYDIPDDRRRNQLAKVLKGFGTRVQYSVFEAHLNRTQYEELKRAIARVIDLSEDSVRYYALCGACVERVEVPAVGKVTSEPKTIVV